MNLDDFDYNLPKALIAQKPLPVRTDSRLLTDIDNQIKHSTMNDFPEMIKEGDLIVLNNTRVLPARFHTKKPTGGKVEILLLERTESELYWEALVKPSRRIKAGTFFKFGEDFGIEVLEDLGEGIRKVRIDADGDQIKAFEKYGEMPLPPYINKKLDDQDRYQTIYSQNAKSSAAPTAGLHITEELLERCVAKGARIEFVELVVGLDTFRPISSQKIEDHKMHSEFYEVSENVFQKCSAAKRVIAVGTTTVRALETAALKGLKGRTDIFIKRPFEFKIVDVLLTNFHLPKSTLLIMLDAFVGERWRLLYEEALSENYRFLSFGDAMLLQRQTRDALKGNNES